MLNNLISFHDLHLIKSKSSDIISNGLTIFHDIHNNNNNNMNMFKEEKHQVSLNTHVVVQSFVREEIGIALNLDDVSFNVDMQTKVNLGILKDLKVNYAPDNVVATFTPDDKGAAPVIFDMELGFVETEIMTKQTIALGF